MGNKTRRGLLDYRARIGYEEMNDYLSLLCERYSELSVTSLGQTVEGRRIPMASIGRGGRAVLYVGALDGREWQTSAVLLRCLGELCEGVATGLRLCNCSATYLHAMRTVHIVPMLDPDGVERGGRRADTEEVGSPPTLDMGDGARLSRDFPSTFDECRLETMMPESGALRNYLMFNRDVRLVLALRKGGGKVECTHDGATPPRLRTVGEQLSRLCGYPYGRRDECGSICGFCSNELFIPSFEVGSPFVGGEDFFFDYWRLRSALLLAPTLV